MWQTKASVLRWDAVHSLPFFIFSLISPMAKMTCLGCNRDGETAVVVWWECHVSDTDTESPSFESLFFSSKSFPPSLDPLLNYTNTHTNTLAQRLISAGQITSLHNQLIDLWSAAYSWCHLWILPPSPPARLSSATAWRQRGWIFPQRIRLSVTDVAVDLWLQVCLCNFNQPLSLPSLSYAGKSASRLTTNW